MDCPPQDHTEPNAFRYCESAWDNDPVVATEGGAKSRKVRTFDGIARALLSDSYSLNLDNRDVFRAAASAIETSVLPNKASCSRLISTVLMEIIDDWQPNNAYMTFTE